MKKLLILLFAWPLMAVDCVKKEGPTCHHKIQFLNNSDDTILNATLWHEGELCNLYGDTVLPHSTYEMKATRDCWEDRVKYDGGEKIYIVDARHYNEHVFYSCDSIEIKNKVLKRYILTVEYLKEKGFTIAYP